VDEDRLDQDQMKAEEHVVLQVTVPVKNRLKKEVLVHQKEEKDQDPALLVLQSLLPQNLDPEADHKTFVFHCLP